MIEEKYTSLLRLNSMAHRLGVSPAWLRNEADSEHVPCLRAGNHYIFAPKAVERVLVERASRYGGHSRYTK